MRMMAPDGTLGDIPADQVQAAQAEGFRTMTSADLSDMYQRIHMKNLSLQEKDKKIERKYQRRSSLRGRLRRGRSML